MSGKWDDPNFPKHGWSCETIYDDCGDEDAALTFTCEMCEVMLIRYVHVMSHPTAGRLETGCICAGHMEGNVQAAEEREKPLKNRAIRRHNFPRLKRWKVSRKGNEFIRAGRWVVTIYSNDKHWSVAIIDRWEEREPIYSKLPYFSSSAAKLAAFDRLERLNKIPRASESLAPAEHPNVPAT